MTDYCLDVIFSLVTHSFREVKGGMILDDHLADYEAVVTYLRRSLKDRELHLRIEEMKRSRELQLKEKEKQRKAKEMEDQERMRAEHHFFIF